jgi:hypothetical protein
MSNRRDAVPIRDSNASRGRGGMKHRSSQILFAHWNQRRGERALPERGEIDPGAIRGGLGDTFILEFNPLLQHPFRLAGTRVCALFGGELKGRPFVPLWDRKGGGQILELLRVLADEAIGIVGGVTGTTGEGDTIGLELLLLPLRHWGHSHVRLIGALSPLRDPYWLGAHPLCGLALGEYRYMGASVESPAPPLPPRDEALQRRRGLVVYNGGQA